MRTAAAIVFGLGLGLVASVLALTVVGMPWQPGALLVVAAGCGVVLSQRPRQVSTRGRN